MLQPRYLLMINPPPGCISSFRTFREYIQEELRKANQRQRVIGLHMSTSNNPPGRGCPSNFCIDDLAGLAPATTFRESQGKLMRWSGGAASPPPPIFLSTFVFICCCVSV